MSKSPVSAEGPLARSAVLSVLQQLIRTPSVNPTLAPHEPYGEGAIAAFAREWFASKRIKSTLEEVAPGRSNVVAELGRGSGPTLVLCAHLDTVGTDGMTISPFKPNVRGNRVYGRGSYDMKGGVAAIMSAAAELASNPPPGKIIVALVVDEEYASIGTQAFVARHKADACIVTEASEARLILGHKGFIWVEIVTRGRAVHGSRWDIGVSAIGKMGRIIAALEQFDQKELRLRVHPLVGPASQHCSMVEGGSGLSTYAETCTLKLERRTLPGETPEQVMQELKAVVSSAGEEAEVRSLLDRPPLTCSRNAKIAECLRDAANSIIGTLPEETGVGYWMDTALFAAAGIATVDYGPTGSGAHEPVEWVELDSVVKCAAVLAESARLFCQS